MHPILFHIGPLTLYSYGLMLALGAGLGLWLLAHLAEKSGLDRDRVTSLALWVLVSALAGSRLVFVALEPAGFVSQPWRVLFIWEGGLVFYGGVVGGLAAGILLARRWKIKLLTLFDCFGPPLALGQALGRVGCFLAGCCYGLPWENGACAVTFTDPATLASPRGVPLYPTQLFSAGALGLILLFLLWLWPRRRFAGQVFFSYGFLHGIARAIIEQYRGDYRGEPLIGTLTPTAVFGLGFALFSLVMLVILARRQKPPTQSQAH